MLPRNRGVNNTPTPIYANGIVIGRVIGDTFHKTISGSKHMLRRPPAIAFDRSTLRDAAAVGAVRVEVYDRESHMTYTVSLEIIDTHGITVNRGHNPQIGLRLDHWSINGAPPVAEQRAAQTNQEREELQMDLFGGLV